MFMAQKVRDIMSGPPVTVSPDTDLATAAKKMRDENVGAILVTEGDDLTGVVTDRDLVRPRPRGRGGPQVQARRHRQPRHRHHRS